jgi:hypothetical protein
MPTTLHLEHGGQAAGDPARDVAVDALQPRLWVDLIVVPGGPMADITLLEQVDIVIKGRPYCEQGMGKALRIRR